MNESAVRFIWDALVAAGAGSAGVTVTFWALRDRLRNLFVTHGQLEVHLSQMGILQKQAQSAEAEARNVRDRLIVVEQRQVDAERRQMEERAVIDRVASRVESISEGQATMAESLRLLREELRNGVSR